MRGYADFAAEQYIRRYVQCIRNAYLHEKALFYRAHSSVPDMRLRKNGRLGMLTL